jgi:hypothetical protein
MNLYRFREFAEWKMVGAGERLCRMSPGRANSCAPHLGVVLTAWDGAAAAQSVDMVLERLRNLKGVKWSMVVVANNDGVTASLAQAKGEYRLVAGSNREAEFSAYEEGRQTLLEKGGAAPDVWIILNDRLPFYGPDCLWGVTPALLQFAKSVPIAAGTVDFLPRYFQLLGKKFRCYIRSNYVLVSAAAIDRIGSFCPISANEYASEVPTAFPGQDWPLSAWLGAELAESLRVFLTVPGGVRWTRAEPLTAASWPRLRRKALSIVNEWVLSQRLIEEKVPIVPWRLARAMSCLSPEDAFLHQVLDEYRADPGFGGGLEGCARGRLQLAAAVVASRAGSAKMADALLSSAVRSSTAARPIQPARAQGTWWNSSS